LRAKAGRFSQTPFATRRPAAAVGQRGFNRLTHNRGRLEAGMEGPVGRHVNGHRQVDEGDATQDHSHLAQANGTAEMAVPLRHRPRFFPPTHRDQH